MGGTAFEPAFEPVDPDVDVRFNPFAGKHILEKLGTDGMHVSDVSLVGPGGCWRKEVCIIASDQLQDWY